MYMKKFHHQNKQCGNNVSYIYEIKIICLLKKTKKKYMLRINKYMRVKKRR